MNYPADINVTTEVERLPCGWELTLLDSVAKRGSGHTPDKKHPEYWGGSIRWVSLQDSAQLDSLYIHDTAAKITIEGIKNSSAVLHPKGTVVLSRDAGVGKSAVMADDMAVSQHFMAWTCGQRLNNHFLYYWLQAKKPEFERIANGNTIKTIGLPYFKELMIPLPKADEQERIASALSNMDALISGLDQLIAKKRDIQQATMQQLLTGQRRLPGFSGEWEVKRLGELATFLKGRGLSKNDLTAGGVHPCIHYGELFTHYSVTIQQITSRTNNNSSGCHSKENDVLMPTSDVTPRGLAKASCIKLDNVILGGDILIIRTDANIIDGSFLSYVIRHDEEQVLKLVSGTTVFHLYGSDMKRFSFKKPSFEEQTAISTILSVMDTELAALEARRDKALQLKQGMMQELLTGRIRLA